MNKDIRSVVSQISLIKRYLNKMEQSLRNIDQHRGNITGKVHETLDALESIQMVQRTFLLIVDSLREFIRSTLAIPKSPCVLLGFWWIDGAELDVLDDSHKKPTKTDRMIVIPKNKTGAEGLKIIISEMKKSGTNTLKRSQLLTLKEDILIGSSAVGGEIANMIADRREGQDVIDTLRFYDFVCILPPNDSQDESGKDRGDIAKTYDLCKNCGVIPVINDKTEENEVETGSIAGNIRRLYKELDFLDEKVVEELLFLNPIEVMKMIRTIEKDFDMDG